MIYERDEQGFFEKVITIHPLAARKQKIALNNQHLVYEFDLGKYFYPKKVSWLLVFLPFKFLIVIAQIIILIKKENINLIRATDHYLMGLMALLLARLTRLPFCISIHSNYEKMFALNPKAGFKQLVRVLAKWIPRIVLPRAQLVMPIRECYINHLVTQGARKERIRVIPHGIDLNFCPDKNLKMRFNIPADKKVISFVGRLAKDNYIDDMLKALEKLSQIRSDFILIVVGSGQLEADILEWFNQHPQAKPAIRLLGFQSYQTARSVRYISDISLCLMGGFSLIEAGAAGSALVAYDVEWHYELVENHVTGFLIPEHHIDKLVTSICYLLDHACDSKTMGENAKKKVFKRHDLVTTTKIKQTYYLELLHETAQS